MVRLIFFLYNNIKDIKIKKSSIYIKEPFEPLQLILFNLAV